MSSDDYRGPSSGYITGTLLPLKGEPQNLRIPSDLRTKEELKRYLAQSRIFASDFSQYSEKIELGFYFRIIMTDYKKNPRPCMIFRFSKGTVLPENYSIEKWRADPWKKTYGPIIILRIQDGNTQFRYEDYRLVEFQGQCMMNKRELENQGKFRTMSPSGPQKSFDTRGLHMYRQTHAEGGGFRNPISNPRGFLQSPRFSSRSNSPFSNPYSAPAPRRRRPVQTSRGRKWGGTYAQQLSPTERVPIGHSFADLIYPANFEEKIEELASLAQDENWGDAILYSPAPGSEKYVPSNTSKYPILYDYIYRSLLHALGMPRVYVCRCGESYIIHSGLLNKSSEYLYIITQETFVPIIRGSREEHLGMQAKNYLLLKSFLTWHGVIDTLEGSAELQKPQVMHFAADYGAAARFNTNVSVELNFRFLSKEVKSLMPQKWRNLDPFLLKMLLDGIAAKTKRRIARISGFPVFTLYHSGNDRVLSPGFLIPFRITDPDVVDFVLAVKPTVLHNVGGKSVLKYLGFVVMSVGNAYSLNRLFREDATRRDWLLPSVVFAKAAETEETNGRRTF